MFLTALMDLKLDYFCLCLVVDRFDLFEWVATREERCHMQSFLGGLTLSGPDPL